MKVKCDYCKTEFNQKPSRLKRNKNNFCCKKCADLYKGSLSRKCQTCGKSFKCGSQRVNAGGGKYCSKECKIEASKNSEVKECFSCGAKVTRAKSEIDSSKSGRFYCSAKCKAEMIANRVKVGCIVCGKEFEKSKADSLRHPNHCCSVECRNVYNRNSVCLPCGYCGTMVERPKSMLSGKKNIFCSKACFDKSQQTQIQVSCKTCGKEFMKHQCYIKRSDHDFCSVECSAKHPVRESKAEKMFAEILRDKQITFIRNDRHVLRPLEIDFYFPEFDLAVEINGPQHYQPIYGEDILEKQKSRDRKKRRICKKKGIRFKSVSCCCSEEQFKRRLHSIIRDIHE